jgi:AraC-like DNA-binding protein
MDDGWQIDPEAQLRLADIRVDGVGFSAAPLTPPFCVSGLTGPVSLCYVVRGAALWLEVETSQRKTIRLEPGSFVGLSGVIPHWFKSDPGLPTLGAPPLAYEPLGPQSQAGGAVELIIGHAPIETLALTNTVNGAVVVPPDDSRIARRLRRAVEGIEDELRDPDPIGGASAVIRRLAETMLLNMARYLIASPPEPEVPVGAWADVRIMRAIAAAAQLPLEPWTVGTLANVAGMSRTAFARQFKALTGDTPISMLARIRLRAAAETLDQRGANLEEAAAIAGYGSSAAFIRAFRRAYDATPAQWRAARLQQAG